MSAELKEVGLAAVRYLTDHSVPPQGVGHVPTRIGSIPTKYVVTSREWLLFPSDRLWLTQHGWWNVRPDETIFRKQWMRTGPYQSWNRVGVDERAVPGQAKPVDVSQGTLSGQVWCVALPDPKTEESYNARVYGGTEPSPLTTTESGPLHWGSQTFERAVAAAVGRLVATM